VDNFPYVITAKTLPQVTCTPDKVRLNLKKCSGVIVQGEAWVVAATVTTRAVLYRSQCGAVTTKQPWFTN